MVKMEDINFLKTKIACYLSKFLGRGKYPVIYSLTRSVIMTDYSLSSDAASGRQL